MASFLDDPTLSSYLNAIPHEIWSEIFVRLDNNRDKANVRLVCKLFKSLIDGTCSFDVTVWDIEERAEANFNNNVDWSHVKRINKLVIENLIQEHVIVGLQLKHPTSVVITGGSTSQFLNRLLDQSSKLKEFELSCTLFIMNHHHGGVLPTGNLAKNRKSLESIKMYQVVPDRIKAHASARLARDLLTAEEEQEYSQQGTRIISLLLYFPNLAVLHLDFKNMELSNLYEFALEFLFPFISIHATSLKELDIKLTPYAIISVPIKDKYLMKVLELLVVRSKHYAPTSSLNCLRSLALGLPTQLLNTFVVRFLSSPPTPKTGVAVAASSHLIKLNLIWGPPSSSSTLHNNSAVPKTSDVVISGSQQRFNENQMELYALECIQALLARHKPTLEKLWLININLEKTVLFHPTLSYSSSMLNHLDIIGRGGQVYGEIVQDFSNLHLPELERLNLEQIQVDNAHSLQQFVLSCSSLRYLSLDKLQFYEGNLRIDLDWMRNVLRQFPNLVCLDIRSSCLRYPPHFSNHYWDPLFAMTKNNGSSTGLGADLLGFYIHNNNDA